MLMSKLTGTKGFLKLADRILATPIGRAAWSVYRCGVFVVSILFESQYWISFWFRRTSGVAPTKRDQPLIVSLTSIAPRLNKVVLCIESLLRQSIKPDKIILWLGDDIPPDSLPAKLKRLQRFGLDICFRKDLGPHTKIQYTLREYPEAVIVTCDDDLIYPRRWLELLYNAYREEPDFIHCYRAHLITRTRDGQLARYDEWAYTSPGFTGPSMLLFPTGVGGVLYPPNSLYKDVLHSETFMELAPWADDVWLKAMSAKQGTLCKKLFPYFSQNYNIVSTQKEALFKSNVSARKNDAYIQKTFGTYGIDHILLSCGEDIPIATPKNET